MIFGIGAMILVGLSWPIFGIVMGKAPKQNIDVGILLFLSAVLALFVSVLVGLIQGVPVSAPKAMWGTFSSLLVCGILNYLQLDLMSKAMQRGPNGIIWSITQAAFVFPFFMGILFFGVALTWFRGLGFLAILAALALFAYGQNSNAKGAWKLLTFSTFLTTGAVQILSNLPSYIPEAETISSVWRTAVFSFGLAIPTLLSAIFGWKKFSPKLKTNALKKKVWFYCIALQGFELFSSFFLLYPGMNLLAEAGIGAVAYPLMVGACIVGFELYAIILLREKRSLPQWLALFLCLLGITGICF